MTAIFETVLHMSAVAGIVIFTLIIVRFCLKNAPKKYSYLLWAIVLLRLLCPFTVESALSTIPRQIAFDPLVEVAEPVQMGNIISSNTETPLPPESMAASPVPEHSQPAGNFVSTAPAPVDQEPDSDLWMKVLSYFWLGGVAVMVVWGIVGYIRLRARLGDALLCEKGVYLSYKVDSPFVLGIIFPKIYLPATIKTEEWNYILLHERCHIRRGDHIVRLLAFAALAVHWFNPLVWLAFILSGKDMEMSCDESVVQSMGPAVRSAYSASLLSFATGRPILSGMPLAFGEGDPKVRIRNLAKWRKPTTAMIIAAIIVCIVAAVCLLTDPVERDAQIKVNGRVYTYTGDKENPADIIWELGTLEGIVNRSDEEPTEDFHGANLDEKYAGQPLYACLDGRIYLFDEEGYYLPFELPKGDIVSGPIEVARGDFNRDGQSDFITVTEYPNSVEIALVDSQSAKILWTDTASVVEGQQKCFTARKDEKGDSIIRDTFHEEGYCNYIRFFIGDDGELVEETGRSHTYYLREADYTDPEAISYSLPEKSTFLLSTYGGSKIIGPIKSAYIEASDEEAFCKAALRELAEAEALHYTWDVYTDSILPPEPFHSEAWLHGNDWLHLSTTELNSGAQSSTIMETEGEQYVLFYSGDKRDLLARFTMGEYDTYGRAPLESVLHYDLRFLSKTETGAGTMYSFAASSDETRSFNAIQSYVFDGRGGLTEVRFEADVITEPSNEVNKIVRHKIARQTAVYSFCEASAKECREAIDEAYEAIMAEAQISGFDNVESSIALPEEASIPADAIIDDGSDVIAVPYGESVVIDLDGDGVEEVLCIKASDIYGFWSLTVNGEEYIDNLELYLGADLNPEPDQFPNYYVVRTYKGDYSPKICVFDNGPSGDPRTHFFTFNHSSTLQYHGYVPCHVSNLSFDGNHHMTGPARLSVFQTWYAEHTWYLPNNGTKLSEVERDFYYVDDFEFISYDIDGVYYPPGKYGPLLCDVYAYGEMDISAEALVLKEGTKLSILGTDNKEWLLVADTAGTQYYLHLCGINATNIDTPRGETFGNSVFKGLHYFD